MRPVLIGYFPKRRTSNPGWLIPESVEEIASVSNCITKEPAKWIGYWRHNEMFVFDTPELALSVVADEEREGFEIHTYAIFPVQYVKGRQTSFELPALSPQTLPDDYEFLGYDVVSRSCGSTFECSPLSCNGYAEQVAVNRWCLLDDVATAFELAERVELSGGEPGPYFVVEVWRARRQSSIVTACSTIPCRHRCSRRMVDGRSTCFNRIRQATWRSISWYYGRSESEGVDCEFTN